MPLKAWLLVAYSSCQGLASEGRQDGAKDSVLGGTNMDASKCLLYSIVRSWSEVLRKRKSQVALLHAHLWQMHYS